MNLESFFEKTVLICRAKSNKPYLYSGTVGDSLVGVDALVQLLAIEEILQQLLDLGDPGGATNQHNVVDGGFVQLSVPHGLLNGLQGALEQVRAQLFESGPGDGGVEVDTLEQGVDFDVGLSRGGQSPLGSLARSPQPSQSSLITLKTVKDLLEAILLHKNNNI